MAASLLSFMDNLLTPHHTPPNKKPGGTNLASDRGTEPILRSNCKKNCLGAARYVVAHNNRSANRISRLNLSQGIHSSTLPSFGEIVFLRVLKGTCVFVLGKGVRGRIILRWIFGKWDAGSMDWSASGQGQMADSWARGNEPSGSMKCREFYEWLRTLLASQEGLCSICLFSTYALQPSRFIVRSGLDVPTFATRRIHAWAPSAGRWNCEGEMSENFA
jgi:hypothetical protein